MLVRLIQADSIQKRDGFTAVALFLSRSQTLFGNALVCETPFRKARMPLRAIGKQSFQENCVPSRETGNEGEKSILSRIGQSSRLARAYLELSIPPSAPWPSQRSGRFQGIVLTWGVAGALGVSEAQPLARSDAAATIRNRRQERSMAVIKYFDFFRNNRPQISPMNADSLK
jgi:hypothetical protein